MKKKYYLFVLIIFISCFSFLKGNCYKYKLAGKVIYLDPGHGGRDPGTNYQNIKESNINLSICLILRELLEKEGATVYLTREGDYDLSSISTNKHKKSDLYNRIKLINTSHADLYISIHLNATPSSKWHGAQVFYDDINKENVKIAEIMTKALNTKRNFQEIKNMYLNKNLKVPGVLIEVGFLSNYNDRILLTSNEYQIKVSEQIVDGIVTYFQNKK